MGALQLGQGLLRVASHLLLAASSASAAVMVPTGAGSDEIYEYESVIKRFNSFKKNHRNQVLRCTLCLHDA